MNRQRLSGFSLMEMMVVLLIVSIVAAASAPMVNRKMVADAVGGCKWGEGPNTIFYNGEGLVRTVAIGTQNAGAGNPRLHIETDNDHPHIRLTNGGVGANIHYVNTSTLFTTDNPTVTGSVIIGRGADSLDNNAVAIGLNSDIKAGAVGSIAIGAAADVRNSNNANVANYCSIAIGAGATVDGSHSVAVGGDTRAVGTYDGASFGAGDGATALGWGSWAVGNNATAIGMGASTYGVPEVSATNAVAIGSSASATSPDSIAIGAANALSSNSIAIGCDSQTLDNNATAIGIGSTAQGAAVAIGSTSNAGYSSVAVGSGASVTSLDAPANSGEEVEEDVATGVAIGSASAAGPSVAVGPEAYAMKWKTVAIGSGSTANDKFAISVGSNSNASGANSIAIGRDSESKALGTSYGVSVGANSAVNRGGVAIGSDAVAFGANSIAIGSVGRVGTYTPEVKYWHWNEYHSVESKGAGTYRVPEYHEQETDPGHTEITAYDRYLESKKFKEYADKLFAYPRPPRTLASDAWPLMADSKIKKRFKEDLWLREKARMYYKPSQASETGDVLGAAEAKAASSIAIGVGAKVGNAQHTNSVALGTNAQTTAANQIVLGTADTTVYIPGNLVVGANTYLGARDTGSRVSIRANKQSTGTTGTRTIAWGPSYSANHHAAENTAQFAKDIDSNYGFNNLNIISSDRRLKNVGEAFKAGLEELKKLELFHYTYKKDESKIPHVGVMAQDLMKIFPDAVWKGEDGFYRIRMEDMFYALVNAVKELDAKIEALKNNEIAELRKRVDDLEKVNAKLAKQNEKIVEQNEKLEKDNEKILKRLNALERKVK